MSIYDIAAVDRLTSLQSRKAKNEEDRKDSPQRTRPYRPSSKLPTSPVRDKKSDAISASLARYQASLSRPESPNFYKEPNDDIPSNETRRYGGTPSRRSDLSARSSSLWQEEGGARREQDGARMPNNSNRYQQGNGLHLVNSTRTTSSLEGNGSTERLWDTLPSRRPDTRSSRTPSRRLGTMDQEPGTPSRRLETMNQGSPDASSDNLTQFRYPYLSSAYSLPRNCRLLKANRQISGTIRESLENLSSSSQNLAFTESRESLLKRYPSSSLCASPVSSPAPSRKFVGSYSCRNSPTRSTNQSSAPRRSETQSRYSSERSSRRTSPEHTSRGGTLDSQSRHGSPNSSSQIRTSRVFPEQNRYDDSLELIRPSTKNYSRDSVPSYSHYSNPLSVQSSRNTSPVSSGNSVYSARSSRHVSPSRYTPSHSARSSRNASPNRGYTPSHSVRSSRNASPNREYTPSHSARSSRNASPNRAYTPSHSARSSRNASPNRGYTPSYSARSSHYNSPVHYPSDYVSKSSRHSSPNKFPHAYSSLSSRDPSPASSYTSSSYKSSSRYVSERTDRLRSQEYSSSRNGSPLKTQPIRMQESPVSVRPATEVSSRASSPASKRGGSPSSRRSSIASLRSSTSSKHSQKRSKTPHSNNIVTKRKEEMFLPDTGGGAQCVVYVRETFQILNLDQQQTQDIPLELLRSISSNSVASILQPPSAKSNERIEIGNKTEYDSTEASNLDLKKRNLDSVSNNSGSDGKQPNHTDTEKQTFQFNTASRDSLQTLLLSLRKPKEKSVNDEIEKRNVTDVTKDDYDDDDDERVEDREDLDDSARAESIVSITSTNSTSRSRENKDRDDEVRDPHSTIRRQSVIIEGLSMEAEDLKKKVQSLEEELSSIPMVEELQGKLCQVESKLEETESFCYQVVEENVGLKTEIETLESEIAEVQDSFRDKDAKEFKRVKWELENLAKTCRNLQIKLGRTQAKATRLRLEKEELEEKKVETTMWKTTAFLAAALVAGIHLLSGKLK